MRPNRRQLAHDRVATTTLLKVSGLVLAREHRDVIGIEHLTVDVGEVVALIGPSGCGKSTLLSHLSGTFPARRGEVTLPDVEGDVQPRTYISRSVQGAPLFHWLTVRQNLKRAAQIKGVRDADLTRVLEYFAADHLADRYPASLSGGERCRASLSQALLGDPRILLLDEPFSGLDVTVKRFVAQNIFKLAREAGAGVVFVTHDLYDAVEYADRVVVLGGHPTRVVGEVEATPNAMDSIAGLLER